ncbi:MAG: ankyrin repeat domain-containing protein [Selenomonadaceae bacterium]|nr:ankyrin repeat domain-containing protein [Selenomonadaceae bacterium]
MNKNVLTSLFMSGAIFLGATLPATTVAANDLDKILGAIEVIDQTFGSGKKKSGSSGSNDISVMSLSNQKHARPNPTHQEKLFMLAVEKHDIGTAKEMLAAGVDVNGVYGTTDKGITPFYRALLNNDREMMQFLLENGANVNGYCDFDNRYICYFVNATQNVGLLEYLHNWGADINGIDYDGNNALLKLSHIWVFNESWTVRPSMFAMMEYLCKNGIDIDRLYNNGDSINKKRTLFLWAIAKRKMNVANLLAKYGANLNARDNEGKGALDIALETSDLQVYKAVQDIMARGQQPSIYREKLKAKNKK